jgi:23S rRNA (uridine2552-2'-O)-methyltransferase
MALLKTRVKTAKGRPIGSTRWLDRQLNDPYVLRARREGYRARSVYKLLEIDEQFGLLRRGMRIVDLGAAPGSWSQYAGRKGVRVVAIDLQPMDPVPGVEILQGDFLDPEAQARITERLEGPVDLVLSDMAASSTGQRAVDRLRAEALGEAVLTYAAAALAPGGHCLIKLVRGAEAPLQAQAKRSFRGTRLLRPKATRADSSEIFILAQDRLPAD